MANMVIAKDRKKKIKNKTKTNKSRSKNSPQDKGSFSSKFQVQALNKPQFRQIYKNKSQTISLYLTQLLKLKKVFSPTLEPGLIRPGDSRWNTGSNRAGIVWPYLEWFSQTLLPLPFPLSHRLSYLSPTQTHEDSPQVNTSFLLQQDTKVFVHTNCQLLRSEGQQTLFTQNLEYSLQNNTFKLWTTKFYKIIGMCAKYCGRKN